MKPLETSLTQKGQVTIPKEVRARLGLKPKDRVRFEIDGDSVRIVPARSRILAGFGAASSPLFKGTPEQVRDYVEQMIAEDVVSET